MHPLSVQVIKNLPRDRSAFEHLAGFLSVTVMTTSYFHVSLPQLGLQVKDEELIKILDRDKGLTENAIRSVTFEDRYVGFHTTGNIPSIPASSIKGNIRSRIELSFKAKDGKARSCFIRATEPIPPPKRGMHGWRHHGIWGEVLLENREACDATRDRQVCLVCDLFGTNGLQSLIGFSDFVGEGVRLERLNLEYGMDVLAAPPNSRFDGSVNFLNLKPEELGLLLIGMGLRDSMKGREVLIGRFKYRKEIKGYKLGRAIYRLDKIGLYQFSKPLSINSITLMPGQSLEGDALNEFVKVIVANALHFYEGELKLKDEVSAVENL